MAFSIQVKLAFYTHLFQGGLMKTVPLRIRHDQPGIRKAPKRNVGRKSLRAKNLRLSIEEGETPVTCHEWAQRLRTARTVLTEQEHNELGINIEQGIALMRRERLH